MDKYSVYLRGKSLDIDTLKKVLVDAEVTYFSKAGDLAYWSHGRVKQSQRGKPFEESSIHFSYKGEFLLDFINYLLSQGVNMPNYGVEGIEIHALMERSGQINGELHSEEIIGLAKLNAEFTWSVIYLG